MNKNQVEYHLRSLLKEIELPGVDHVALAEQSKSYQRRIEIQAKSEEPNPRADALRIALDLIEKFYHVK